MHLDKRFTILDDIKTAQEELEHIKPLRKGTWKPVSQPKLLVTEEDDGAYERAFLDSRQLKYWAHIASEIRTYFREKADQLKVEIPIQDED